MMATKNNCNGSLNNQNNSNNSNNPPSVQTPYENQLNAFFNQFSKKH
jgi:hypothetical protein